MILLDYAKIWKYEKMVCTEIFSCIKIKKGWIMHQLANAGGFTVVKLWLSKEFFPTQYFLSPQMYSYIN